MKIQKYIILIPLTIILNSCDSLIGSPDIKSDCTTNGFGLVSCSFMNEGTAKGSICVKPYLSRVSYYESKDYDNSWIKATEIETASEICSGLVEPQDVVERQKSMTFVGSDLYTLSGTSPSDFCSLDRTYGGWSDGCVFGTRVSP